MKPNSIRMLLYRFALFLSAVEICGCCHVQSNSERGGSGEFAPEILGINDAALFIRIGDLELVTDPIMSLKTRQLQAIFSSPPATQRSLLVVTRVWSNQFPPWQYVVEVDGELVRARDIKTIDQTVAK